MQLTDGYAWSKSRPRCESCDAPWVSDFSWTEPFPDRPWEAIDRRFATMADLYPDFRHMSDIVKSVLETDRTSMLAGFTSMHDLLVVAKPIPQHWTPVKVLAPNAPFLPQGMVRIEHLSASGRLECIERPVGEAVPLFWRFVKEKFGVEPGPRVRSHRVESWGP